MARLYIMLYFASLVAVAMFALPAFGAQNNFKARVNPLFKAEDFPAYLETLLFKEQDIGKDYWEGPIPRQWGKIDATNSLTWGRWTVSFGDGHPAVEVDLGATFINVFFYNLTCANPVFGENNCMIRLVTIAENRHWYHCVLEISLEGEVSIIERFFEKSDGPDKTKNEKSFNINCPTEFMIR